MQDVSLRPLAITALGHNPTSFGHNPFAEDWSFLLFIETPAGMGLEFAQHSLHLHLSYKATKQFGIISPRGGCWNLPPPPTPLCNKWWGRLMQILNAPLVGAQGYQRFPIFMPVVGHIYIALYAVAAYRASTYLGSAFPAHSTSFSLNFFYLQQWNVYWIVNQNFHVVGIHFCFVLIKSDMSMTLLGWLVIKHQVSIYLPL